MKSFRNYYIIIAIFNFIVSYSQSDFDKALKSGEVIVNGLSLLKGNKSETKSDSKIVNSVCIKNKLADKIIFVLAGKDENGDSIKKELIIQNDGKECIFELQKGLYTYEIILANKETYRKGEYKFNEEIVITVKED